MSADTHNDLVLSLLAGRTYSNRGLILALSSVLFLMAGGFVYLLWNFHNVATSSAAAISLSSTRYSVLFTGYRQAIDACSLAERAKENPNERKVLVAQYVEKIRQLAWTMDQYGRSVDGSDPATALLQKGVSEYGQRVDSVLKGITTFSAADDPSRRNRKMSVKGQEVLVRKFSDYSRLLRADLEKLSELERGHSAEQVLRASESTRNAAIQWFVVSGLLFGIAGILMATVMALENRTNSLVRRFKTILDNYVNPLAITDPAGRIRYVNAEFEKWSAIGRDRLVGENVWSNISPQNGTGHVEAWWTGIHHTLISGKSWSGEVEAHHPNGEVSNSMLIALPILGQSGRMVEAVTIFQDISDKKNLARQVEEAREQYQNLVESSLDGIVVVQDEKLVFLNPAAVRIFQYESPKEMLKLSFVDTIAPASRPFLVLDYRTRSSGEEILKNYEMKGLTKGGKLIDLEINARAITWNGSPALHVSFRDITERKTLERQQAIWLWEQETLSSIDRQLLGIVDLQKVLDIILQQVLLLTRAQFAGIAMIDVENQQAHWRATRGNRSQAAGIFFRLNAPLMSLFHGRDQLMLEDFRKEGQFAVSDLPPLDAEGIVSTAFLPLVVNGQARGRLIVGFRQPHRFPEREIRVLTSMAEKSSIALTSGELYEDLLRREKELELLSGARVQAQEDERRRISREIHDGLGQLLTAIKFNLEMLEDNIPHEDETSKRLVDVKQLLDNVMKEAREISYNLMPSVLDDFGLAPGLLSLCDQFSKGTGIKVSFHEHGLKDRLNADLEIGLYRIVQEALNNIAKHAEAKEVEVQIVRHADVLRLTVEDDGKGMLVLPTVRSTVGAGGTGLVSMRERATSLNGLFVIDSTPGKGTMISVEIPIIAH